MAVKSPCGMSIQLKSTRMDNVFIDYAFSNGFSRLSKRRSDNVVSFDQVWHCSLARSNSAIPRLAGDMQDLYDRPDKNRNRGRMGNVATVNITLR